MEEKKMKKIFFLFVLFMLIFCTRDNNPLSVTLDYHYKISHWINYINWKHVSIPLWNQYTPDLLNKSRLNWYNPFNRVPVKNIWPDKVTSSRT